MSWTPTFMIRESDWKKVVEPVLSLDDETQAWKFTIDKECFLILIPQNQDISSRHRDLHEAIESISHWIVDGESSGCNKCIAWGESIDLKWLPI